MDELTKEKCTACRRDSPRVTEAEIGELRPQIPEWAFIEREGVSRLERVFRFSNFADAVAFTNRIAALAEDFKPLSDQRASSWYRLTAAQNLLRARPLHGVEDGICGDGRPGDPVRGVLRPERPLCTVGCRQLHAYRLGGHRTAVRPEPVRERPVAQPGDDRHGGGPDVRAGPRTDRGGAWVPCS